ncbi:MAG: TonB C-terminal domain-containing protein [Deltaproteobacteria bacterium]|nr:TonB C-terminal domain-containing protein [Deltaproteobacteria bacterium]
MALRRRRSLTVLAVCVLGSAAINWGGFVGIGMLMDAKIHRQDDKKEEVTFLELRDDLPTPEPKSEPPRPDLPVPEIEPLPPKPKRPKPEPEPPEPEPEKEPEPEPPPEPEPEPEPEPPQQQPDFVLERLKMVEQPDALDEKEAPDDVEYLSNINRDVQEQTRARVTNLERDAIETQASQLEASDQPDVGTANEDVIAQDEQKESRLDRQAPDVKPSQENQRPEQNDPQQQSMLAMRELEYREHTMAQEANEALADAADDGALRPEQSKQASLAPQERQARITQTDPRYRFKLAHKDLDALFGKTADAKKRMEAREQSKRKGVWDDARASWQSPLENMVPEVQVGNQTALRSRKHPFARYIAQMHRKIHEAWAWGFLDQQDSRGRKHSLNDFELWTRVEIVLDTDGRIDKVITVRYSGNTTFDAAAREIVYAAGPYPDPPASIRSGNGKVYMHWAFHRDARACGTFGAHPFILDNAGQGDRPDPGIEVRAGKGGGERLARRPSSGGSHAGHAHAHPKRNPAPDVPDGPQLPPGATGPSVPPSAVPPGAVPPGAGGQAPRAPGKSGGSGGSGGGDGEHKVVVVPPPKPDPEQLQPPPETLANDPQAKKAAREWMKLLQQGKADKLAARSSIPFYSGETIVARTRAELTEILGVMAEEAKDAGKPTAAKVYTASGLRKVFGSVPAGVQEGNARVYGLSKIQGEYLVLMLEKKFGRWRVVGIAR